MQNVVVCLFWITAEVQHNSFLEMDPHPVYI